MDHHETTELLRLASRGDGEAVARLLKGHRVRLRRMVALRLDSRLAARLDASDVVQEALTEAAQRMSDYLRRKPIAFYPWLRQIAWDKLLKMQQRHLGTQKRSVNREEAVDWPLPDESMDKLASRFVAPGTHASERLLREELQHRIRMALEKLSPRDREVLVLRYLEQLSLSEAVEVLGISEEAFTKRHMRAIQRLRRLLDGKV